MENDDEYEGIFNDDEVVDIILYEEVEKDVQKKNSGCFTKKYQVGYTVGTV